MELTLAQIDILKAISDAPKFGHPPGAMLADLPRATTLTWNPLLEHALIFVTDEPLESSRDLRRVWLTEEGRASLTAGTMESIFSVHQMTDASGAGEVNGVTYGRVFIGKGETMVGAVEYQTQPTNGEPEGYPYLRTREEMEDVSRLWINSPLLLAAARTMLNIHDSRARRANFSACGCPDCERVRPIVEKIEPKK